MTLRVEETYPRIVRQMLMSRSGPQPATRKTPRGGTGGVGQWAAVGWRG